MQPELDLDLKVARIARADIREAVKALDRSVVRYLVDRYYQSQKDRVRTRNRLVEGETTPDPNALFQYLTGQAVRIEETIKAAMGEWMDLRPVGQWMMSIHGVGPVLAAGIYSHIDIQRAPTVSALWRLAGFDPSLRWVGSAEAAAILKARGPCPQVSRDLQEELARSLNHRPDWIARNDAFLRKGEPVVGPIPHARVVAAMALRPWVARLKTLCWKFADCQVKFSNDAKSFYGPLWRQYKADLTAKNAAGRYADTARDLLKAKKYGDNPTRAALEAGRLSDGHIHARSMRWIAKVFLSHVHEAMMRLEVGRAGPSPWVIAHGKHVHWIDPPNPTW